MKARLLLSLILAGPAVAQRPTAEVVRTGASFWPLDANVTVIFTGVPAQPVASGLRQAPAGLADQHLP